MSSELCAECADYGADPRTGLCVPCEEQERKRSARVICQACGERMPPDAKWRMDDDGFTACLPAFPRSNFDDRPMEGVCYRKEPRP